ncbi:TetR family transcriptional regulator [Veronia nyctiphanis]|uniref:TetR family transcriptional regulator n=1 Tax=Veronia nyctiphanis TaxID=1278244 RepID=A0A4Q0YNH7_9GAMM|nr:TetR/AcrR family transcriptional regulator [Veronia nyctiphanis]RXJ71975.1 TetR family transcriptional regulator [Veronia nyctiphanis]
MKSKHQHTQQHLLDVGRDIFSNGGFSSVGLSTILKVAGVPKGSFYHYFESKEHYGKAVLIDYFAYYQDLLSDLFQQPGKTGQQKLMALWQAWQEVHCDPETQKCLVVKLSAEVADLSEPMRLTLRDGTEKITQKIADVIEEGINDGSLHDCDAYKLSAHLYQLWLGASLLTKLHRDGKHLELAMETTRSLLGCK